MPDFRTYPRELRTERLLLRQWRDDDVAALHRIYTDPEVERQLVPMTPDATAAQVAAFRERWRVHLVGPWAADELDTGRFVGRVGLNRAADWPPEPGAIEVGWTLDRSVWGRGYATEGGAAALRAGYRTAGDLDEVISFTRVTNVRSRRVMERLGLTECGETGYHGIPHVWYRTDREQWLASDGGDDR